MPIGGVIEFVVKFKMNSFTKRRQGFILRSILRGVGFACILLREILLLHLTFYSNIGEIGDGSGPVS